MIERARTTTWIRVALAILGTAGTLACERAAPAVSGQLPAVSGQLDVVLSSAGHREGTAARDGGHLELYGLSNSERTSVSSAELATNGVIRRELPAGLYAASWSPGWDRTTAAPDVSFPDPALVRVLPGEPTTLTLRVSAAECTLASR